MNTVQNVDAGWLNEAKEIPKNRPQSHKQLILFVKQMSLVRGNVTMN